MTVAENIPNQMWVNVIGLEPDYAMEVASYAAEVAYRLAPKVTGDSAGRIAPIYGDGFFGLTWADDHIWFQEMGTNPRTMNELAGKTIPMWVEDPMGKERSKNPRARTRTTMDGRQQTLIFRRAARKGQTKKVRVRTPAGNIQTKIVPASYPGAPGRISRRIASGGFTPVGKIAGQIARGNVGVRWRHPGLQGRGFLSEAIKRTVFEANLEAGPIQYSVGDTTKFLRRSRQRR